MCTAVGLLDHFDAGVPIFISRHLSLSPRYRLPAPQTGKLYLVSLTSLCMDVSDLLRCRTHGSFQAFVLGDGGSNGACAGALNDELDRSGWRIRHNRA